MLQQSEIEERNIEYNLLSINIAINALVWGGAGPTMEWSVAFKNPEIHFEFLHSAQQKQTFKFQATEQDLEFLRFRSKNSLQLTWSTITVGTNSDEEEIFVSAQQMETQGLRLKILQHE